MNRKSNIIKARCVQKTLEALLPSGLNRRTAAGTKAEPEPKVVKVKRFAVKPMSVIEAADQMELLSHDFFLFRNAETRNSTLSTGARTGTTD